MALQIGMAQAVDDYPTYIEKSNPVGWWSMNEAGAENLPLTADRSGLFGRSNNGTPLVPGLDPPQGINLDLTYNSPGVTTMTDQPGFVSGSGNRAARFIGPQGIPASNTPPGGGASGHTGGIQDNLSIPDAIYRYPGGFAGEFWIKADQDAAGIDTQRFIGTREFGFGFIDGSGPTRAFHFTTFGVQDYIGGTMPNDGNWHQIGFSFNGVSTVNFYVDGAPVGTVSGANPGIRAALSPAANSINLGRRNVSAAGQQYRGYLDEAVIWNHARTDQDFLDSYNAALLITPQPSYSIWASGNNLTGNDAAADFDHDNDGLQNGIEYILGTDPKVGENGGLDRYATEENVIFFFNHAVASKTPDTQVFIDARTSLTEDTWTPYEVGAYEAGTYPLSGIASEVTVSPGAPGYEVVSLTVPIGTDIRKFARLRVVVTP